MYRLLFATLLFASACNSNKEQTQTETLPAETKVSAARTYACPMQCEGDKTYAEAGKCPVCKMDLQEVALNENDSTLHAH